MTLFKSFLTILILFVFLQAKPLFAQQAPNNPLDNPPPDPAPATQAQPLDQTNTSIPSTQQVTTSNRVCVKVGEASDTDKPASCNQPAQTQTGFIGPIEGTGPTIEYCGDDPMGNPLMCQKPGYVFYCQGDPRWGSACSMSSAGCGPTTMAMILSAYGDTIIPPDMDKMFQQRGWRSCGDNPSYMQTAIQTLLPEMGYEYHALGAPLNLSRAQEYLNAGYLIIGSTFGHIFVIDGVNVQAGTVSLRDPARCENKSGVVRSAGAPWGGQALYYSYAVKKKPR